MGLRFGLGVRFRVRVRVRVGVPLTFMNSIWLAGKVRVSMSGSVRVGEPIRSRGWYAS